MKKIIVDNDIYLELAGLELSQEIFDLVNSNRAELGRWLNWVPKTQTVVDTEDFLKKNQDRFKKDESGTFAICFQGKLAGLVDLHGIDEKNNKSSIGYWLDKNFYGKGIMTKSVAAILNYAFDELGINRIVIEAAVGNVKSKAVAKRLGFKFEGVARESNKISENKYLDMEIYALLKSDWVGKNIF